MLDHVNRELVPIKAHYFLYNAGGNHLMHKCRKKQNWVHAVEEINPASEYLITPEIICWIIIAILVIYFVILTNCQLVGFNILIIAMTTGPIVPFLPTIAKQLGFSGFLVGSIYTVLPISGLIAKPLFGGLADKYRLHKTFFLIFQAVLAISFFLINFIPKVHVTAPVNVTCDNAAAFMVVCSPNGFSKNVLSNVITTNATHSKCHLACNATSNTYTELCTGWKAIQFCGLANTNVPSNATFDFEAEFSMDQDLKFKKCVDIRLRNVSFADDIIHKPVCNSLMRTSCIAECYESTALKKMLQEANTSENPGLTSTYQFHLFLWAAIVSWVGMSVVVSIGDAICFDLLGDERRKEYGKQKMWGSIGFGIFGISAGYLVDVLSRGSFEKDYTCIFYIMLIAMIFDMIVSATLRKKSIDYSENEPSVLWELSAVAREGRVLVFGFWCVGAGICTGVVWNFLFWYTEELVTDKEAVVWLKTLQGLMTGVQCFLGELPFNFLSGRVLKKLGHINVMSLVLLIYAVRFMAYSLVTNAWMFLVVELLHGPTLGLCWPTMVSYGDKVAPSGTKATMQGFVGAVFEGIGVACGSLLCGRLIDTYGGVITFRAFSAGALVWLSIYWVLQLLLRKAKAYPIHQGHNHLASYATPSDAILMTASQELQTY